MNEILMGKIDLHKPSPPMVSIVIPCYNYGELIHQTLDCLLRQSYHHWEAIIVDDGSTDDTKSIVEEYQSVDNRFHYIYQENKGLSSARNTGIQNAKGQYLQFLDADDLLSVHKIATQLNYMEVNKDVDISYTDARYFTGNDLSIFYKDINKGDAEWMPKCSGIEENILDEFVKTNIMPVNSALVRVSFMKKEELLFDISYRSLEDWHFWLLCLLAGANFSYIEGVHSCALIRIHNKSMSHNKQYMNLYDIKLRHWLDKYLTKEYIGQNKGKLVELNKASIKKLGRNFIRANDTIRFKKTVALAKIIGWPKTLVYVIKEFNEIRKNKHKNAPFY